MIKKIQQAKNTYYSILANILRKWDRWIYSRSYYSLRRMAADSPGLTYLRELQIHEWNENSSITPALKNSAEIFHGAIRDSLK